MLDIDLKKKIIISSLIILKNNNIKEFEKIVKKCYISNFSTKHLCQKYKFDTVEECKEHE